MMKAAVRNEWINRLRHPERYNYEQITGMTRDDEVPGEGKIGVCAMGVLYEMAREAGVARWSQGHGYIVPHMKEMWEWAGTDDLNPVVRPYAAGFTCTCCNGVRVTACNDSLGMTFPQIADLIEKNVPVDSTTVPEEEPAPEPPEEPDEVVKWGSVKINLVAKAPINTEAFQLLTGWASEKELVSV